MWNEEGHELKGEEINAEIRSWELVADHDNLSKKARESDPFTRARMQPRNGPRNTGRPGKNGRSRG